jgi:hypothetical protein
MALFALERAWRPSQAATYRMMVASAGAAPSEQELGLLLRIVESTARLQGDSRPIQVNGNFGSDHINVALLPFQGAPASLALPKEGFVSLPPNVMAVDLGAFRSILFQTFNDVVYFAQAAEEAHQLREKSEATDDDVDGVSRKYGALSLQLRLATFSSATTADKYAPMMAAALKAFEVDQDFYLAFVFPIAHELYHLRSTAQVGMDITAEELAADRFAAGAAQAALQANRTDSLAMRFQLLFIGVRFYQDRLLQEVFQGVRGLGAQSLLVGLMHAPCKVASQQPWPRRFNSPDVVVQGFPLGTPILSSEEVALMIARLDTFTRRNHPHLLLRIDQLRKVIAGEPGLGMAASGLEFSADLLKFYTQRAASVEMFDWITPGGAGPKPVADIVKRLHLAKERVTAKGCEEDRCITAKVGPGYVDILADGGRIRSLTIAQPMTDITGVASLLAALDEFAGPQRTSEIMLPIGASLKECGVASDMVQLSDYTLTIRTMNEDKWIEARFFTQAH